MMKCVLQIGILLLKTGTLDISFQTTYIASLAVNIIKLFDNIVNHAHITSIGHQGPVSI